MGMRIADILIKVSKGDAEKIISEITNRHSENVLEITIRLGHSNINIGVRIAYRDNSEIYEILQTINMIEYVENVQWSEILKEIVFDKHDLIQNLFSRGKDL